jgi:hypothetical protein
MAAWQSRFHVRLIIRGEVASEVSIEAGSANAAAQKAHAEWHVEGGVLPVRGIQYAIQVQGVKDPSLREFKMLDGAWISSETVKSGSNLWVVKRILGSRTHYARQSLTEELPLRVTICGRAVSNREPATRATGAEKIDCKTCLRWANRSTSTVEH